MTTETRRFWSELGTFSERFLEDHNLPARGSKWGPSWLKGKPIGIIYHFTKGTTLTGPVRWFCDTDNRAHSSAHVVIAQDKHPRHAQYADGLPLMQVMPVTVVQCRFPHEGAHHATWVNGYCYGIENVSPGILTCAGTKKLTSRGENYEYATTELYGRTWAHYPVKQIDANIILTRRLSELYPNSIAPGWMLGHEQVQGVGTVGSSRKNKRDPGPHFPLWGMRAALDHPSKLPSSFSWYKAYLADGFYGQSWRDGVAIDVCRVTTGKELSAVEAMRTFKRQALEWSVGREPFGAVGKGLLALLGYDASLIDVPVAGDDDKLSLYIFARMSGINRAVPRWQLDRWPVLRSELIDRAKDRGFF